MNAIKNPYMGQETNGHKSQCSGMACFFIHSFVSHALQCSVPGIRILSLATFRNHRSSPQKSPMLMKKVSIYAVQNKFQKPVTPAKWELIVIYPTIKIFNGTRSKPKTTISFLLSGGAAFLISFGAMLLNADGKNNHTSATTVLKISINTMPSKIVRDQIIFCTPFPLLLLLLFCRLVDSNYKKFNISKILVKPHTSPRSRSVQISFRLNLLF